MDFYFLELHSCTHLAAVCMLPFRFGRTLSAAFRGWKSRFCWHKFNTTLTAKNDNCTNQLTRARVV